MSNYRLNKNIINSRSRRRGQALLMAVLIMIFVVLLGTTFIAIVASNMNNTARTGSKDAARQAAKAGIEYADSQLTDSDLGLDWRPTLPSAPGSFYYSSFDQAQGWNQAYYTSQTGSTVKATFVKYPNPQGTTASSQNTANFMIRVSQVIGYGPNDSRNDPDNSDNTKTGDIRIESIGFADDDPAAYYEIVAYKRGPASNPLTAAMRSVTNWDFNANTVPQGYVNVTGPTWSGTSLTLTGAKGYFDNNDCPFYVTITTLGNMNNAASPQVVGAKVTGVTYDASGEPSLALSGTATVNITSGSTATLLVQKAANLGAPLTVNFDNATATPVDYRISGINNLAGDPVNSAGSVWVNGGLVWFGTNPTTSGIANFAGIQATNLVAPSAATSTNPASIIKVSGLFTSTTTAPATTPATVQVSGTTSSGAVSGQLPVDSVNTLNTDPLITSGLVDDGLNRLQGSLDPTRQAQSFTPPDITSGGDGFGRYRQMTRYSMPDTIHYPSATIISSAYGYGQGVYINNPQDVEKIGSTPMNQTQLHDLWFGTGTTNYNRLGMPDDSTASPNSTPNAAGGSLEEQHMRGWVSPDQFLPRGAEVIINDDNTITINLDPLADNSAAYPHANFANTTPTPDPAKCWRSTDGTLSGDVNNGGVYSRTTITWPANGTIFAEGNIRIRGVDTHATTSLTVVSMNNIYIDGSLKLSSLSGSKPKVLLLAKKNVIVNPTLALAPVQSVTTLSEDAVPSSTTVSVYDTSNFNIGDYITFGGSNAPVRRITNKSSDSITFTPALPSSATPTSRQEGHVVFSVFDPRTDTGFYTSTYANRPYNAAIRLTGKTDVLQRRIWFPTGTVPDNLRLAFRHSAEYKKALTLQMNDALAKGVAATGDPTEKHTDMELAAVTNKALEETYKGQSVITPGPDTSSNFRNKYLKIKYRESVHTTDPATGTPNPVTYDVNTDLFAVDRLKANEGTYTTDPYPIQQDTTDANSRYAAANISLGHLLKQMIDRNATVTGTAPTTTLDYDKTHWRYGELIPDNATQTITGVNTAGAQIDDNYGVMTNGYYNIDGTTPQNSFDTDNANTPRYYFMASMGNKLNFNQAAPATNPNFGAEDSSPDGDWPQRQEFYPAPATGVTIPMATSVWLWMNGSQAILQDNTFNQVLNSFGNILQFGFSPLLVNRDQNGDPIDNRANYSDYADWEDALTSDQYFYQPRNTSTGEGVEDVTKSGEDGYIGIANYQNQTDYDTEKAGSYKVNYTLDSRVINNLTPSTDNEVAMSLDDTLVNPANGDTVQDYFNAKPSPTAALNTFYNIPYYRLSNLKLQNEKVEGSPPALDQVEAAKTFDINAYVYAQEGGWYVIPGTYFDANVKNGSSVDQDLNRDGVISQGESAAAYRYHRYNYQIVFTGAIMENQTASDSDVGDWTDKWATVKLTNIDFAGGTVQAEGTAGTKLTYNSADPVNNDFNTILYFYDPTAAQGALSTDSGFHAPVAAGLIYQG